MAFHEKVDGNWGGWKSPVSVSMITGSTINMVLRVVENQATVTVTDELSHSQSATTTLSTLLTPGLVGVYHDNGMGLGAKYFDNFTATNVSVTRTASAEAVQVVVPLSLANEGFTWPRGDYVRVTGIAGTGTSLTQSLRAVTLRQASDFREVADSSGQDTLFPTAIPSKAWFTFSADGYSQPVCGNVYRMEDTVTNGMALGGIDTGCTDLETSGLLGYTTIFNTHAQARAARLPILGLSTGGQTWVLCNKRPKQGSGGAQVPVIPVLTGISHSPGARPRARSTIGALPGGRSGI